MLPSPSAESRVEPCRDSGFSFTTFACTSISFSETSLDSADDMRSSMTDCGSRRITCRVRPSRVLFVRRKRRPGFFQDPDGVNGDGIGGFSVVDNRASTWMVRVVDDAMPRKFRRRLANARGGVRLQAFRPPPRDSDALPRHSPTPPPPSTWLPSTAPPQAHSPPPSTAGGSDTMQDERPHAHHQVQIGRDACPRSRPHSLWAQ